MFQCLFEGNLFVRFSQFFNFLVSTWCVISITFPTVSPALLSSPTKTPHKHSLLFQQNLWSLHRRVLTCWCVLWQWNNLIPNFFYFLRSVNPLEIYLYSFVAFESRRGDSTQLCGVPVDGKLCGATWSRTTKLTINFFPWAVMAANTRGHTHRK